MSAAGAVVGDEHDTNDGDSVTRRAATLLWLTCRSCGLPAIDPSITDTQGQDVLVLCSNCILKQRACILCEQRPSTDIDSLAIWQPRPGPSVHYLTQQQQQQQQEQQQGKENVPKDIEENMCWSCPVCGSIRNEDSRGELYCEQGCLCCPRCSTRTGVPLEVVRDAQMSRYSTRQWYYLRCVICLYDSRDVALVFPRQTGILTQMLQPVVQQPTGTHIAQKPKKQEITTFKQHVMQALEECFSTLPNESSLSQDELDEERAIISNRTCTALQLLAAESNRLGFLLKPTVEQGPNKSLVNGPALLLSRNDKQPQLASTLSSLGSAEISNVISGKTGILKGGSSAERELLHILRTSRRQATASPVLQRLGSESTDSNSVESQEGADSTNKNEKGLSSTSFTTLESIHRRSLFFATSCNEHHSDESQDTEATNPNKRARTESQLEHKLDSLPEKSTTITKGQLDEKTKFPRAVATYFQNKISIDLEPTNESNSTQSSGLRNKATNYTVFKSNQWRKLAQFNPTVGNAKIQSGVGRCFLPGGTNHLIDNLTDYSRLTSNSKTSINGRNALYPRRVRLIWGPCSQVNSPS